MLKNERTIDNNSELKNHLITLLSWGDAHVDFDSAVEGIPEEFRGKKPEGLPYSAWQLLEHIRIAQRDILEFCIDENYRQPNFPDDYWAKTSEPPSKEAWDESVNSYREDLQAFVEFISNPSLDIFAEIPHGQGQTYLREALLIADHAAYHIGELITVRRILGVWK